MTTPWSEGHRIHVSPEHTVHEVGVAVAHSPDGAIVVLIRFGDHIGALTPDMADELAGTLAEEAGLARAEIEAIRRGTSRGIWEGWKHDD